ncbi:hypothetical protein [Candidatus Clostridium radicumherbarum]|uniref:Uncharacterized protein n=1 Tax=Candidatus Clostridium radicumherbarum TaxID=3381662 RepID=A0ABW8TQL2_9CLOT
MRDIFNGNIKNSKSAIIALVLFSIIMFVSGIFFLITALFYHSIESSARILLLIFTIISFAITIIYPVLAIYFVRRMDKYPHISRMFFKDYIYVDNKNKKDN